MSAADAMYVVVTTIDANLVDNQRLVSETWVWGVEIGHVGEPWAVNWVACGSREQAEAYATFVERQEALSIAVLGRTRLRSIKVVKWPYFDAPSLEILQFEAAE